MIYDKFPVLGDDMISIHVISEADVDALSEITGNPNVYKYIPPFLFQKSRGNLLTAIRNLSGRDFEKKKMIIAGVYLKSAPDRLIGLSEIFDYKSRAGRVTIGYRINEACWHMGIATRIIRLLVDYLTSEGIRQIRAEVMTENAYSARALLKNGFVREQSTVQVKNWGGMETVEVEVYTHDCNQNR